MMSPGGGGEELCKADVHVGEGDRINDALGTGHEGESN